MKRYIKWVLRVLIISPFILGIPIGIELLSFNDQTPVRHLSTYETIMFIPGLISCIFGPILLGILVLAYIVHGIIWIFEND